jgi:MFS family permease
MRLPMAFLLTNRLAVVVVAAENTEMQCTSQSSKTSAWNNIIFAGIAFSAVGYAEYVLTILNIYFPVEYPASYTSQVSSRVSDSLLVGAIVGQISLGIVSDRVGREVGLIITTILTIVGTALCAGAYGYHNSSNGLFWALVVYRGIVGVGIGGEYPCATTNASEATEETNYRKRGLYVCLVSNVSFVLGGIACMIAQLILFKIFGITNMEPIWRISFGLGVIPMLTVFYFRLKMFNSRKYREEAIRKNPPYLLVLKEYAFRLIGTCGSWFVYDFVAFSNGIFGGTLVEQLIHAETFESEIFQATYYTIILALFAIPGAVVGALTIDRLGRKLQQIIGFVGSAIFAIIIGAAYPQVKSSVGAFITLYGIFNFFGNFGAGSALGLIPAEIYPTAVRATCYGISAAVGKAGGAIGTQVFRPIMNHFGGESSINGPRAVFIISGGLSLIGAVITWVFIPEFKRISLDKEDEKFRALLREHGFAMERIGMIDKNNDAIVAMNDEVAGTEKIS